MDSHRFFRTSWWTWNISQGGAVAVIKERVDSGQASTDGQHLTEVCKDEVDRLHHVQRSVSLTPEMIVTGLRFRPQAHLAALTLLSSAKEFILTQSLVRLATASEAELLLGCLGTGRSAGFLIAALRRNWVPWLRSDLGSTNIMNNVPSFLVAWSQSVALTEQELFLIYGQGVHLNTTGQG